MTYEDIRFELSDGVGIITFDRPEVLNAFRSQTTEEICAALNEAEADPAVRCIVLTGAGRAFSAGADLKALAAGRGGEDWTEQGEAEPNRRPASSAGRTRGGTVHAGKVLLEVGKPTVAAVNGVTVGGGLMFCLAADIRIASDQARFSVMFTNRGLTPEAGITYFLPRIVGLDNAMLMTYTARMFDAEEALKMRLVTRVVNHETLMERTLELAAEIAAMPTVQLALAKKQMLLGLKSNELEVSYLMESWGLLNSQRTQDYLEGHRAFYERREPRFEGR